MKNKIVWHIVDHKGHQPYGRSGLATRDAARRVKVEFEQDMFEPWNDDIEFPIRIEREEWVLVSRKVVA